MPRINREKPNGKAVAQEVSGWQSAAELEDDWIKIVIYGTNRVGKTWLACDFPKPLALVACEPNKTGGARTVKAKPGVFVRVCTSREQVLRTADDLSKDSTFKTVVLDSGTSLQDLVLKEILGLETLPEQLNFGSISGDAYRQRAELTKETIRPFLNLDKHVVITVKEKDHNPPKEERISEKTGKIQPDMRPRYLRGMQQESFIAPDLGGGTTGWLLDACDYICRLYWDKEVERKLISMLTIDGKKVPNYQVVETGRFVRALRTLYHPNYAAGFRSEHPNVPECIEDPSYEKILRVIRGESL